MENQPALSWLFPAFLILCTGISFAWGAHGFILWWATVLSFFVISVILALFGIFLPDPGLWIRDLLAARKLKSKNDVTHEATD